MLRRPLVAVVGVAGTGVQDKLWGGVGQQEPETRAEAAVP